jgi:hypothetical protein
MTLEFLISTLFTCCLIFSIMMWYVYIKNHRFAEVSYDMLYNYPVLVITNWLLTLILVIIIFTNSVVFILIIILSVNYLIQFIKFYSWFRSYQFAKIKDVLSNLQKNSKINFLSWDKIYNEEDLDTTKINVVVQHNVDISLKRALRFIGLEKDLNIPSCYLFRYNTGRYKLDEAEPIISYLNDELLFEVGFHYESIRNANGDLDLALDLFQQELAQMREYTKIRFIAAYDDKFNNRKLVDDKLIDFKKFGIKSCYYINHDIFISDAGGLVNFQVNNNRDTFLNHVKSISNQKPGSLIHVLLHTDWWF